MPQVKVTEENIHDLVEEWHNSDSDKKLHEYLGLTFEQYAHWATTDELPKKD